MAAQVLRAAGCHVIGCDPIAAKRDMAAALGAEVVCDPDTLDATVRDSTAGYGADGVIICAASKGSAVTNQALDLCRQKGRVVVVGAVGMHLERDALYANELDFMLSCSYGPGRYNPAYEERGLDYPMGYVRWTQGRNMAEFLRMIDTGRVRVKPLISVTEPVERAGAAYAAVTGGGDTIAALLHYGDAAAASAPPKRVFALRGRERQPETGVAVIGAGAIATGSTCPTSRASPGAARRRGQPFGPESHGGDAFRRRYCTTDYNDILKDDKVDAVIIATRHHLHKEMALASIAAGKHVFVEKPLALTVSDCDEICAAAAERGVLLTVGFNRRFAPLAVAMKAALGRASSGPATLLYRCNAGALPKDHWALDPVQGGGRIRGEAVHFFDFARWLLDDDPVSVDAARMDVGQPSLENDSMSVVLRFSRGSVATILYSGAGSGAMDKERIEVFSGGASLVLDDFKALNCYGIPGGTVKARHVDKGLGALLANFIAAVKGTEDLKVTGNDGRWATYIAEEAIRRAGQQ